MYAFEITTKFSNETLFEMTHTKTHIVEEVTELNGYPNNQLFDMIEILLEVIKRTLKLSVWRAK